MTDGVAAFPLRADERGRTEAAAAGRHTADMVEAVLFTSPGERVHLPDFGCGLGAMVFAPASEALAGAAELQVRSALARWLGDRIDVDDVSVDAGDGTLVVRVAWTERAGGASVSSEFRREA